MCEGFVTGGQKTGLETLVTIKVSIVLSPIYDNRRKYKSEDPGKSERTIPTVWYSLGFHG